MDEDFKRRLSGGNTAPQDAFETGEDAPLLAKLKALKAQGKSQTLAMLSSNEIRVGALIWKPTGLLRDTERELTRADWEETGRLLKMLDSSLQWLIGDLIVCGEDLHWGEQKQIAEAFGFDEGTVYNYSYVCRKVEISRRRETLSFGHHQAVAALKSEEDQTCFLQSAVDGKWSVARLRKEISAYLQTGVTPEALPKYLQPMKLLRQAYSPEQRKKMTKGEQRRVISELEGMIAIWKDELGETL